MDKRSRRIKSGNRDKKKDEAKSALSRETPNVNGLENPATDSSEQPQQKPTTPSFIMQTISDLAQRPLEMVDSEILSQEQDVANFENAENNTEENFIEDTVQDINKLTDEVIEKTEDIKVVDEIECN